MKMISLIIFVLYFTGLIYVMFFGFNRITGAHYSYNLIPFNTLYQYIFHFNNYSLYTLFINLLGNIAVFIPFGILLPIMNKQFEKPTKLLVVFIAGIFILEVLQLFFRVGAFDVDDIILNAIGAVLGQGIYLAIKNIASHSPTIDKYN